MTGEKKTFWARRLKFIDRIFNEKRLVKIFF